LRQVGLGAREDRDVGAVARKRDRDRFADPAARTGDERDLAGERLAALGSVSASRIRSSAATSPA
jgi:hypothetical protein